MGVKGDIFTADILQTLKLGVVDTTNNVFKLFANITPAIFWMSSAIIIASSYIGDPIQCKDGNDFINTVCWIHGTYHISKNINKEIYNQDRICKRGYGTYGTTYYKPEQLTEDAKDTDTTYYQWVPFMLVLHGFIFLASAKLWKVLEGGLLEQFGTRKEIKLLVEPEEVTKRANQSATRFMSLSRRRNNRYFMQFVLCEFGNIVALTFNFCLIDLFLGGRFKYYGSDVARFLLNKENIELYPEDPMCSAFPTLTACDIRAGGAIPGSVDKQSIICILSQNIINQKIYLALWLWMILLIVSCSLNTIYRISLVLVPALRKAELVALINTKRRESDFLDKDAVVRNNWEEIGRVGNWFVMQQIGRNSNPYYFRHFIQSLMELDQKKGGAVYSDNVGNKNITDVEDGTMNEPLV